jgi:hypothetical protein
LFIVVYFLLYFIILDPVPANELNKVEKCGMGARSECLTIIGLWAVGLTGYCINGPMEKDDK